MNKFLPVSLFLLIISTSLKAQTYVPFIDESRTWDLIKTSVNLCGNTQPPLYVCEYYRLFFDGDTIINSVSYNKLMRAPLTELPSGYYNLGTPFLWRLMREDTSTQQVFQLTDDQSLPAPCIDEILVFDFNQNVGDKFVACQNVHHLTADTIYVTSKGNVILLNGDTRKVLEFGLLTNLIEGIGGSASVTHLDGYFFEQNWEIICVKENGAQVWGNNYYYGCPNIILNTQEAKLSTQITFSPNPVNDLLNVDLSALKSPDKRQISIYDANGRAVRKTETFDQNLEISITDLPQGIYWLEIQTEQEFGTAKFIKL